MNKYVHFGSELGEEARLNLELGKRVIAFLEQPQDLVIPININIVMLGALWAGYWREVEQKAEMRKQILNIVNAYESNPIFTQKVDQLAVSFKVFKDLVEALKRDMSLFGQIQNGGK